MRHSAASRHRCNIHNTDSANDNQGLWSDGETQYRVWENASYEKKEREEEEEGGDKGKTSLEHYSVSWECNFRILNAKAEL